MRVQLQEKTARGSLYINDSVLFSYGSHFPLTVRRVKGDKTWYLQNGDKRSNTTSKHQGLTFRLGMEFPRVSFSALDRASINYKTCNLVDYCKDVSDSNTAKADGSPAYKGEVTYEAFKASIPFGAIYNESKGKDGEISQYYHRIGAVVLQEDNSFFLCSMDEGSYFISKLPRPVTTVLDAFDSLKPEAVKVAEKEGLPIQRQGEWFFVPTTNTPKSYGLLVKDIKQITLPKTTEQSANHVVRGKQLPDGLALVTGTVYHRDNFTGKASGQHKQVKLAGWFLANRNTELASWSAGGRVD